MSDPKAILADILRGGVGSFPPLFAPVVRAVACQIDALEPIDLVTDPTRLGRAIGELARAGGLDVVMPATPCGMEAQGLGANVNTDVWPPKVTGPCDGDFSLDTDFDAVWDSADLMGAALECTARLAQNGTGGPAIVAALTGPSALLSQICADEDRDEARREFVTAALAALVRKFGTAGADMIVFIEEKPVIDGWADMFGTIGNTAKFLKKPIVIATQDAPSQWPKAAVPHEATAVLSPVPATWSDAACDDATRVIVSLGEVPATTPLEVLLPLLEDTRYDMGA